MVITIKVRKNTWQKYSTKISINTTENKVAPKKKAEIFFII